MEYWHAIRSRFEALGVIGSKSCKKQTLIIFEKNGDLFDPSTPKASNCDPTAREYFTRNHSYKNSFKQCKISYNLIKFCRIWELKVSTESRDNFLCFCTLSM